MSGLTDKIIFFNLERIACSLFSNNSETVYISKDIYEGSDDISRRLERFLRTCSYKKVVFPPDKVFILERQLVVYDVQNMEIDFNNCTLKLPDDCRWRARHDIKGYYVYESVLGFYNCSGIRISNLKIDGNRYKLTGSGSFFGIVLNDIKGFTCNNLYVAKVNYHPVFIYKNTQGIKFCNTKFEDNGDEIINGKSEVYVENNPDDDFAFYDTYIERTLDGGKIKSGQVFYVNGYNGTVDGVVAKRIGSVFDCRIGSHYFSNIIVDECELPFIVQPYPNAEAGDAPSIYVKNVKAKNCYGSSESGAALLCIVGCNEAVIEDVYLEATSDPKAKYKWYGLRIYNFKSYENNPAKNVALKNIKIKGPEKAGIFISKIKDDVIAENIVLEGSGIGSGIIMEDNDAYLKIRNCEISGFATNSFTGQTEKIIIQGSDDV